MYTLRGKSFSSKEQLLSFLNSNEFSLKQTGKCKTCLIETEDIWYVFCSIHCHDIWVAVFEGSFKGQKMGQYDIDKEVYVKWLEDKIQTIESMTTREEIEARILEIFKIEFYAKRESALLHQQYDKITGRKGIAPWLKAERDKLITDPNIKVNWEGEPRPKKEKKPKENLVKNLLGFDMGELTRQLKEQMKAEGNSSPTKEVKEEKPTEVKDAISFLISSPKEEKKEEPKKATPEEIKAKADALKEKIRLKKESA